MRPSIEQCTDAAGLLDLWNESIWPTKLRDLRMLRSVTSILSEPATKLKPGSDRAGWRSRKPIRSYPIFPANPATWKAWGRWWGWRK